MNRSSIAIFAALLSVAGVAAGASPASAQTKFQSYHCTDGTEFIVGFFEYDARAHMQVNGRAVTLGKRLALLGSRYSGGGVTLKMTKSATTLKLSKRPVTTCELV